MPLVLLDGGLFCAGYNSRVKRALLVVAAVLSAVLVLAAWRHWLPLDLIETLGVVSGAWCVWLTARENIWNWPIGIVNSLLFGVLFFHTRLYADMGLQIVYVVLGFLGWYWWLHGGRGRTELPITRTPPPLAGVLVFLVIVSTWGMTLYLIHVHDAAPFWDALTTTLSLAAQYLLTRKMLENWLVWMTADVIYVALYVVKGLHLTAVLYAGLFALCVFGWGQWRRAARTTPAREAVHG